MKPIFPPLEAVPSAGNIHTLRPAKVEPEPVSAELVADLKTLVESAEKGELVGFVMAGVGGDGECFYQRHLSDDDIPVVVAALETCKIAMLMGMD